MSIAEALVKCPQLRLVHVPTYSIEASSTTSDEEIVALPQYRDEIPEFRSDGTRLPPNSPDPSSCKACLEPYRQASASIFKLIRTWCTELATDAATTQDSHILMEKGGLDEVFLDITEEVERQLIDQFDQKYTMLKEELADLADDQLHEEARLNLALYDLSWIDKELDYKGLGERAVQESSNINVNDDADLETKIKMTLGKLRIWKGAQIARDLRARLHRELNFIASIGVASNKMLSKLVSAIFKPDQQTRIDPQDISTFMHRVPFDKIRMMGGKMGRSVLKTQQENDEESLFSDDEGGEESNLTTINSNTPNNSTTTASDLWPLSVAQLADRVNDTTTAQWIHQLIRGIDTSPVTPRSLTKSFMAAKAFRPSVREWHELHDWIVILVTELWGRITEEKETSKRWPASITVNFRVIQNGQFKKNSNPWNNVGSATKSCEFPFASSVPEQATRAHFLTAVFKLLSSNDQPVLPMSRLALSVSNFKTIDPDGRIKATRLDQFFPKSEASSTTLPQSLSSKFASSSENNKTTKNIQSENKKPKRSSVFEMICATAKPVENIDCVIHEIHEINNQKQTQQQQKLKENGIEQRKENTQPSLLKFFSKKRSSTTVSKSFVCIDCSFSCDAEEEKTIQEHMDHHLAIKLSKTID
jgi:nucleotidyltransferase/DNA polymerase involved in DNA repair